MKFTLLCLIISMSIGLFAQNKFDRQSTNGFAGVWELVAVKSIAIDSAISYPYGEHPRGSMLLAADGYYAVQIYGEGRTKIISGNKNTATPDENTMLVKKSNAHFGEYAVDRKDSLIIFKPTCAFFPNWEGQVLKQQYKLANNILTYTSGVSTFGAARSVVVWRKIKQ